jgi:mono/diheme cytochrome c family protein
MTKMIRSQVVLAVAVSLASAVCLAQSGGEAIYKQKCQMCHGPAGIPSAGQARMGTKPVSDPAIKKLTLAEVIKTVKSGSATGKMKAVTSLNDEQIKDVATYFKSLK